MRGKTPGIARRVWLRGALVAGGGAAFGVVWLAGRHAREARGNLRLEEELAAAGLRAAEEEARRLECERRFLAALSHETQEEMAVAEAADAALAKGRIQRLRAELKTLHAGAISRIPAIAAGLGSFGGVARSIALLAKDKITGSKETNAFLEHVLAPLTQCMSRMTAAAEQTVGQVARGVDGNSNALSSRLLAFIEQAQNEDQAVIPSLTTPLVPAIKAIQTNQIQVGLALAGLPLELGAVSVLVKWLRSRLDKWVKRAAATGSANVALAVVDGPLPVGDAIALLMDIGFAIWAVRDVWSLSKRMPAEITGQLRSALKAHHDAVLTAAQKEITHLRESANAARLAALQPVLAFGK